MCQATYYTSLHFHTVHVVPLLALVAPHAQSGLVEQQCKLIITILMCYTLTRLRTLRAATGVTGVVAQCTATWCTLWRTPCLRVSRSHVLQCSAACTSHVLHVTRSVPVSSNQVSRAIIIGVIGVLGEHASGGDELDEPFTNDELVL